jgi:hypothetical protein
MKSIVRILIIMLITLPSAFAIGKNDPVETISVGRKNLFVLKVDRDFIGAHVDVFTPDGHQLSSQFLMRRKMIIDFGAVNSGTYVIMVRNEDEILRYEFVRK